jgi:hypothetical protein
LVTLGPLASGVATSLRVFTGSRPTDLIEVAAYSAPPTGGSRGAYLAPLQAVFLARAGIQYQIQLTDYSYDRGDSDGSARLQLWFEHREISNLRRLADGALVLDFTTSGERDWLIEGSSELRQWLPLDIRRSADGRFRFTDPDAASHPSRFYRLSPLP